MLRQSVARNTLFIGAAELENRFKIIIHRFGGRFHGHSSMIACYLGMPKSVWLVCLVTEAAAQSLGGAGTLKGTVRDRTDAAVPRAAVELSNPVTGSSYRTETANDGTFVIRGIPPNTYRVIIAHDGFEAHRTDLPIRSAVPVELNVRLELAGQK